MLVKLAVDDGASPIMIAAGRFILASTIFGVYILWKRPKWPERSDLRTFLILAFIGVGVYYFFQYYGVKLAGPSISAILVTLLCPVIIFLLSRIRFGERMSLQQKTGLGIATVGSFLVITDGSFSFISNRDEIIGGLFGVLCALFWAIFTVEGKQLVTKYEPFTSTAFISLMGTLMMAPFAVAEVQLIKFKILTNPTRIIGRDGWVKQMECIKMELGEPDAKGRRKPVPVRGSWFDIPVDLVIVAIGTNANPLLTANVPELKLNERGYIQTDEHGRTSVPWVYAGGDIVTGSATVIQAMGAGRRAANASHKDLTGEDPERPDACSTTM